MLVFSSEEAPRRGRKRRMRRARAAGSPEEAAELPATRVTVVRATRFEGEPEAAAWLATIARDPERRDAFAADALVLVNAALHVHRAATMDPYVHELGPHDPTATRIGYGEGEELAAGRWSEAVDAPPDPGKRERRVDALRPQERLAAVLGGREGVDACETLVLRARLDLDQGRLREAALGIEPAAAALSAEFGDAGPEQAEDLAALAERRDLLARLRAEALAGEPGAESRASLDDSVELCERILRRRRILGA